MERLGFLTDRLMPPDNVVTPFPGGRLVRTPSLPEFWFGNMLHLDAPPAPDELAAWMERYAELVSEPRPERLVLQWEVEGEPFPAGLREAALAARLEPEEVSVLRL